MKKGSVQPKLFRGKVLPRRQTGRRSREPGSAPVGPGRGELIAVELGAPGAFLHDAGLDVLDRPPFCSSSPINFQKFYA